MADAAPPPGFLSGFPPVLVAEAPAAPVPIWRVRGAEAVPAPAAAGHQGPADPPLAMGANGIADWTPQQPFLDVMKTARAWTGHLRGQWGGWGQAELAAGGWLDAAGWPKAIPPELSGIEALLFTFLDPKADWVAGRYRLAYAGEGTIELSGRVANVVRRPGEIRFDFTPGEGFVGVQITRTDPKGSGNHIRDITIVKEENIELFEAGAVFNPLWIARIEDLRSLRFMDWMMTNNATAVAWDDRPRPTDYTYAWRGAPVEVMVRLANEVALDPWFTMPHMGDDGYFRGFADYVAGHLDPGRKAYVEYSNEVWNWMFGQAGWLQEQAGQRWGVRDGDAWLQYAGLRASEMADIWETAFGASADSRLVKVISTMTVWQGLEHGLLEAPLWVAEDPANHRPPKTHFDAYGVAGYFGNQYGVEKAPTVRQWILESRAAAEAEADRQGLTGPRRAAHVTAHRFDAAIARAARDLRDGSESGGAADSLAVLLDDTLAYQSGVARSNGLDLVMYEGGTHVVGVGPTTEDAELTDFFIALNYSPEMGALYRELLAGWRRVGGTMFNAFVDVAGPGPHGSWGHLRHLQDETPRWDALMAFNAGTPAWWDDRPPGSFDNGGIVAGGPDADRLTSGPHHDILLGRAGDDTLAGGGGRDSLHGGTGEDAAILPGRRSDYAFRREGPALVAESATGSVRMVAVETIAFTEEEGQAATADLP